MGRLRNVGQTKVSSLKSVNGKAIDDMSNSELFEVIAKAVQKVGNTKVKKWLKANGFNIDDKDDFGNIVMEPTAKYKAAAK